MSSVSQPFSTLSNIRASATTLKRGALMHSIAFHAPFALGCNKQAKVAGHCAPSDHSDPAEEVLPLPLQDRCCF